MRQNKKQRRTYRSVMPIYICVLYCMLTFLPLTMTVLTHHAKVYIVLLVAIVFFHIY
ncbi:hypothetical protein EDD18DRAFT_1193619 [Armillaria luteobubalina]|uniref:Uncharacterized protein n=1 Tax=Armillaria luteobubalina TaxID=153913 RepID=A0AA39PMB0_9AGAR|nr:hypothetical protein EDD18DRAFT_1193619 [Armillaria luteobubalina]